VRDLVSLGKTLPSSFTMVIEKSTYSFLCCHESCDSLGLVNVVRGSLSSASDSESEFGSSFSNSLFGSVMPSSSSSKSMSTSEVFGSGTVYLTGATFPLPDACGADALIPVPPTLLTLQIHVPTND
jgi:hypothetical protein